MRRSIALVVALAGLAQLLPAGCEPEFEPLPPEDCSTDIDEDFDGFAGCQDTDCWVPGGNCPEVCFTFTDEDADGVAFCDDPDCWVADGFCDEDCDTDNDEDANGVTGCDDPGCWYDGGPCKEVCDSGNDEDGDGAVDCADNECWLEDGVCEEVCEGGKDEDGDGLLDCDDPDCLTALACAPSYDEDIKPMFLEYCDPCHTGNDDNGELQFNNYDDILKPSYYCEDMNKGECSLFRILEPSMPQDCLGCLFQSEIDIIQAWVDAGTPE